MQMFLFPGKITLHLLLSLYKTIDYTTVISAIDSSTEITVLG